MATSPAIWKPDPDFTPRAPQPGDPTFSVIVPTTGRPSLVDTLASIASQIQPGDEIIVVCNALGDEGNQARGNWAREQGAQRAHGSHLLFCDDDDVFLPGAFEIIREFARQNPGRIGLFRRRFSAAVQLQWQWPRLAFGGLQAMSFCIPNVPGKVGHWIPVPGNWSDIFVIQEAARQQGTEPIFCDAVIGHARPEKNVLRRIRYAIRLRTRLRRLRGETYVARD